MIHYVTGDLLKSDAEVLVNTVNCVGVMGKGVALQFKNQFPDLYRAYHTACANGDIEVGRIWAWYGPKTVACMPTKDHWRDGSRVVWVRNGLESLRDFLIQGGYKSVAMPKPGCGNGGLNWAEINTLVQEILGPIDCHIVVYV